MSAWITVTIDDLADAKVAAIVSACQTAALAMSQTDPTPRIITDVIARIRAEIKGCQKNQLDADITTIPADLHSLAARMIVRQMQSRLQMAQTDDERTEWKNDEDYLRRISRCEVPIATPDNPIDTGLQSGTNSPAIGRRHRRFTRRSERGI